ncbi:hypothetical protein Pmani_039131 [Petrolisthes manimaculis]|uniref:Uncharacterized protein n=1 Tax=Petrolisthes manimaculis TaxID=1843537 RepID=A0AAE1TJV5_9EUCA|nr:hypothetical protein Pmani_039131 [Petrolisthes manimaculis]
MQGWKYSLGEGRGFEDDTLVEVKGQQGAWVSGGGGEGDGGEGGGKMASGYCRYLPVFTFTRADYDDGDNISDNLYLGDQYIHSLLF